MLRLYRYRLYPTRHQRQALAAQLAACCNLYNAALEHRRRMWREHGVSVTYGEQSAELRELSATGLLPTDANFWCQQAVLRQVDRAFQTFFRRVARGERPGFPRFKSVRRFDALTWTLKGNAGGVRITERGRLQLQGAGAVKVKWHRALLRDAARSEVKVTRTRDGRRWHVCFCVELPARAVQQAPEQAVGVDLGVRQLVSLSTGEQVAGPRAAKHGRACSCP